MEHEQSTLSTEADTGSSVPSMEGGATTDAETKTIEAILARSPGVIPEEPQEPGAYDVEEDRIELSPPQGFQPDTESAQMLQQAHQRNLEYAQQYDQAIAQIDWNELREDDPQEFAAKRQEFNEWRASIEQRNREIQTAAQNLQADELGRQQAHMGELIAREYESMVRAVPGWRDEHTRTAELSEINRYLRDEFGFSKQELDGVADHRLVLMARKALLHDKRKRDGGSRVAVRKPRQQPAQNIEGKRVPSWQDYESKLDSVQRRTLKEQPNSEEAAIIRLARIL